MGIEILYSDDKKLACMTCNTSDCAFGPVFYKPVENHLDRFIKEKYDLLRAPGTTHSDLVDMWIDWCEATRCPDCGCEVELIEVEEMTARSGCINPDDIGFTTHLTEGCPECGEPVS